MRNIQHIRKLGMRKKANT